MYSRIDNVESMESINSKNNVYLLEESIINLINTQINSIDELEKWLVDFSHFKDLANESILKDYIEFLCSNGDERAKQKYIYAVKEIKPIIQKYEYKLDEIFLNNKFRRNLSSNYDILIQRKLNNMQLFCLRNKNLEAQEIQLINKYYDTISKININWYGENKSLKQMSQYIRSSDRKVREKAWNLNQDAIIENADVLDRIMEKIIRIRHEKAINIKLSNYISYNQLQSNIITNIDYDTLYKAVSKYVVPICNELHKEHMRNLELSDFKPWDVNVLNNTKVVYKKSYSTTQDIVNIVAKIFEDIDDEFSNIIKQMYLNGKIYIEHSKKNPLGSFCIYLPNSKTSYIYINSKENNDDMFTLIHECGHFIHNTLASRLAIPEYRYITRDYGEFASMSIELITMDEWSKIYENKKDLNEAKKKYLGGIVEFLSWAVTINIFEEWIYNNPTSTISERNKEFSKIAKQYSGDCVEWDRYEMYFMHRWKAQPHIFQSPFYYINYFISQIGALQIWKKYKQNREETLKNFKKALELGSSKSLEEVYHTAGVELEFSENTIKELMAFTLKEIEYFNK